MWRNLRKYPSRQLIVLEFSRRWKPTDNGLVEAFNGRLRQERLNKSWFLSLDDAREKVEYWRKYCNGERPHGALGNLADPEYVSLVK
jgi:putative transposase